MPFCEDCDRFYNPNTLTADGTCPNGHHVADPEPAKAAQAVPWHFKVMVVLLVLYLGWRFIQLVESLLS